MKTPTATKTVKVTKTQPFFSYDHPRRLRVIEHFIRVRLLKQPRYLIDRWTIEDCQDIESLHSIDLEKELAVILTQEIETKLERESYTWQEICKKDKNEKSD